jgi:hypothetical protein
VTKHLIRTSPLSPQEVSIGLAAPVALAAPRDRTWVSLLTTLHLTLLFMAVVDSNQISPSFVFFVLTATIIQLSNSGHTLFRSLGSCFYFLVRTALLTQYPGPRTGIYLAYTPNRSESFSMALIHIRRQVRYYRESCSETSRARLLSKSDRRSKLLILVI